MKKIISIILIVALLIPVLAGFFVPQQAKAESKKSPADRVDYKVTSDGKKTEVWSIGENRSIPIEAMQNQVQNKIENAKKTNHQVDIGIQFEDTTKTNKLSVILSSIGLVGVAKAFNWGGNFGAFYVRIYGPDYHPLGSCIRSNVSHYNIIVKRYSWTSDSNAWMNLHLGKYYSNGRKCWVYYDSRHPSICWGLCGPTWSSLRSYLYSTMLTAGVAASSALIWIASGSLATVLWPILIAL